MVSEMEKQFFLFSKLLSEAGWLFVPLTLHECGLSSSTSCEELTDFTINLSDSEHKRRQRVKKKVLARLLCTSAREEGISEKRGGGLAQKPRGGGFPPHLQVLMRVLFIVLRG